MITRRRVVLALGASALAAPRTSSSQQQKISHVGFLWSSTPTLTKSYDNAFTEGLEELGYLEGKNIVVERRWAGGNLDLLPSLATELVQRKVDVIVAPTTPAVQAAKRGGGAIPIVFVQVADPVGMGFIVSFARPGGNITGTTSFNPELSAKRLQLLKDAFPKISRLAVLITSEPQVAPQYEQVERAVKALGIEIMSAEIRQGDDFKKVSEAVLNWHADSLYVVDAVGTFVSRRLIAEFAAKNKLPSVSANNQYAEVGGFMGYGPNNEALFHRATVYVDKILKGIKPADLPVELPTRFELVINMKTAKALGITIPSVILLQTTRVIE